MKIFVTLLLLSSLLTVQSKNRDHFIYDGESADHNLELASMHLDRSGFPLYQVKSNITLNFIDEYKENGQGIDLEVIQRGLDIGMHATNPGQVMTMVKFKDSSRWFEDRTWNVDMEVDVKFIPNAHLAFNPLTKEIEDLMVDDDYLSFTIGKVTFPNFFRPAIKIEKNKIGRNNIKFNRILKDPEYILTEFGADRTLVSIDLARLLSNFERGKTHTITVMLLSNREEWKIATPEYLEAESKTPSSKIKTKFRYSSFNEERLALEQ